MCVIDRLVLGARCRLRFRSTRSFAFTPRPSLNHPNEFVPAG